MARSSRLTAEVRSLLLDAGNEVHFSAVNIWEAAIKSALRRDDFDMDPAALVKASLQTGFLELPVTAAHAARVAALPPLHRDPFDRLLVAQSLSEPMTLLTNDALLGGYGAMVKIV